MIIYLARVILNLSYSIFWKFCQSAVFNPPLWKKFAVVLEIFFSEVPPWIVTTSCQVCKGLLGVPQLDTKSPGSPYIHVSFAWVYRTDRAQNFKNQRKLKNLRFLLYLWFPKFLCPTVLPTRAFALASLYHVHFYVYKVRNCTGETRMLPGEL